MDDPVDPDVSFTKGLIKGKIAEIIFEMMFMHTNQYSLIHFGIEQNFSQLLDRKLMDKNRQKLEQLRYAPDFVKIDKNHDLTLVEVKYRKKLNALGTKEIAEKINIHWPDAWLFEATQEGFYFDSIKSVLEGNGAINSLSGDLISSVTQDKYLALLREFIVVA